MKKVALITGASRGIGRGIALTLARHGYDIAGVATNPDPENTESGLYEVKAEVEKLGRRLHPIRGDVSSLEDHPRILAETVDAFGHVDVLVNNAGVSLAKRYDILETTPESYDRVMGINLRGPFFLTQTVANHMVAHPRDNAAVAPSIIFITSISATAASVNRAEYCISKMGGSMASQLFAVRLAEHGINVYEIQPGVIRSDMTAGVTEKYDALIEGGLLLQKRWGTPEDIGKACAALAEGYFGYATGAKIEVGGGFGVRRL
ncbi:MAG: 3-ketoacyl-ACP reductase [Candidatus Hydrogenedentes bacterium]|nr:3-ketoacyl-ACP reductase [Candidatus Hydrogenedentota bacterium]